jgi:hypothetical protein
MTLRRSRLVGIGSIVTALGLLVARAYGESPSPKVILTPDQVKWAPVASLRPGAQSAVMLGAPDKPGPYVNRVKFPSSFKVDAHSHPDNRTYTVLSGTFYQGLGDKFDETRLMARPASSFYTHAAGAPHLPEARVMASSARQSN